MGQTTGQSTDTQQPLNETTVESSHTITTASLTALFVSRAMDELNKTTRKCGDAISAIVYNENSNI